MESLDDINVNGPIGSVERSLGSLLKGINHSGSVPILYPEEENKEMAFFTRPLLNMSSANLQNDREMANLITDTGNDIHTYIREMLDPRLYLSEKHKTTCPFVDNELAYIPILTNAIEELTGMPDRTLPVSTGNAGAIGQQYSSPDGVFNYYGNTEFDFVFQKVRGNIVDRLIGVWCQMMSLQAQGTCVPYFEDEVRDRRNFECRVYRLNLDYTGNIVTDLAAIKVYFPIVDNIGKEFNMSKNKPRDKGKTTNVRFLSMGGVAYKDPIILWEFNQHTAMTSPSVTNMLEGKPHDLVKIPRVFKDRFKDTGYPIINDETMELEWWVKNTSPTYYKIQELLKGEV